MTQQEFSYNKSKYGWHQQTTSGDREELELDKPRENHGPRATGMIDLFQTTPSSQKI